MSVMSVASMSLADRVVMMHQGGWDEIAIVGGPLLIIGVLIAVARKQRPLDQDPNDDDPNDDDPNDDLDVR
jgi:hypothetical protein